MRTLIRYLILKIDFYSHVKIMFYQLNYYFYLIKLFILELEKVQT